LTGSGSSREGFGQYADSGQNGNDSYSTFREHYDRYRSWVAQQEAKQLELDIETCRLEKWPENQMQDCLAISRLSREYALGLAGGSRLGKVSDANIRTLGKAKKGIWLR